MYLEIWQIFAFIILILFLSVCYAQKKFKEWQFKDMKERKCVCLEEEICLDDNNALRNAIHFIKEEYNRQTSHGHMPYKNMKVVQDEYSYGGIFHWIYESYTSRTGQVSDMQKFARVLHVLNLNMVIFRKEYEGYIKNAIKNGNKEYPIIEKIKKDDAEKSNL